MTRRRVLHDARFLIFISALVGCGPDPAKQALLEQLVTTRSAITAGVTQVTLREREIALRTAAEFANGRLNGSQHQAVADAIDAISQTRKEWSSEYARISSLRAQTWSDRSSTHARRGSTLRSPGCAEGRCDSHAQSGSTTHS